MRAIRSKGMAPEMLVRKLAYRLGFRFRLHRKDLPGKPDLVFPRLNKAVFMHGCFWHQHSARRCKIVRQPKSNKSYWIPKLNRNVERDRHNRAALRRLGWESLVVWECETQKPGLVERKLLQFLK
jgi:DNA mismatch endonuclease (patch repair protein)